jgi:hypothetical protein
MRELTAALSALAVLGWGSCAHATAYFETFTVPSADISTSGTPEDGSTQGTITFPPLTFFPGDTLTVTANFEAPTTNRNVGFVFWEPTSFSLNNKLDHIQIATPGALFSPDGYFDGLTEHFTYVGPSYANDGFDLPPQFFQTAAAPESATWAMMMVGFFVAGGVMRSKRELNAAALRHLG